MQNDPTLKIEKPTSLWTATAAQYKANQSLDDNIEANVIVIGAGFTGLRAALRLSKANLNVVILDAGDVGYGASGRTGGQVNPMLPFNTPKKLRKILGSTYFERLTETSLGSADELFDLIKEHQIDCQARQNGWLRVCHNKRAFTDAMAGVKEWNQFGANIDAIDQQEVFRKAGTNAYSYGILTPKGGAVQPYSLATGLAKAAKQRGCSIYGKSAVIDLKKPEKKWIAKTRNGTVTSDWVIVATNGYSGDLIPSLSKTVIPITPIQIATEPLPDDVIGSILPEGHTISDSRRVIMYARREPDNRMVYGGHGNIGPNGKLRGVEWLIKDAVRVFPQLKDANWSHKWGGRIAITDDHLPHLHEPKPGLLMGLGFNGRGVAMSNVMGRVMADRVIGTDPDALPFPVTSLKKIPFRSLQVAGMGTVIRSMRLLDYLETR